VGARGGAPPATDGAVARAVGGERKTRDGEA
jgi:hypothetical protein